MLGPDTGGGAMLTVQVYLLEFMDTGPFDACEVLLSARVMAGWEKTVVVGGSTPRAAPGAVPRAAPQAPPGGPQTVVVTDYDEARAITVQVRGRTDAQGRVAL